MSPTEPAATQQPTTPPPASPPPMPPPITSQIVLEPDEKVVATVRRHPIGLVFIYLQTLAGVAAAGALVFVLASDFFRDLSNQEYTLLTIGGVLLMALVVFVLLLATSVYRQNKLIITNKGVIQTLQRGPFGTKTSRLSLADVEDVTAEQKGIFHTLFNYGTLNIETSGEMKNFLFPYCPDPSKYTLQIGSLRQQYAQHYGG